MGKTVTQLGRRDEERARKVLQPDRRYRHSNDDNTPPGWSALFASHGELEARGRVILVVRDC